METLYTIIACLILVGIIFTIMWWFWINDGDDNYYSWVTRLHRKQKFEPAVYCKKCSANIITNQQPHDADWVLKYLCSECDVITYITFEHAGFGFECDEQGNLI